MNCSRFVIDAAKELFIEEPVLEKWRRDFPNIPDLEAKLQKLSMHFLSGNNWLKYRELPHLYFASMLASDNKQEGQKRQPKPRPLGARKKSKRGQLDAL